MSALRGRADIPDRLAEVRFCPKADTSLVQRVLVELGVLHDDLEIGRIKLAAVFASPLNRNFAEVTAAFLEAERIGQLFERKAAIDHRA